MFSLILVDCLCCACSYMPCIVTPCIGANPLHGVLQQSGLPSWGSLIIKTVKYDDASHGTQSQ
jgi:hypothetical protein